MNLACCAYFRNYDFPKRQLYSSARWPSDALGISFFVLISLNALQFIYKTTLRLLMCGRLVMLMDALIHQLESC